jgi:hypothetical protein
VTAQNKIAIPEGYVMDHKARLIPENLVKPLDKLEDQLVRKIIGYAKELSAQIARFKLHTQSDIDAFMRIAAEEYETTYGGPKGNVTFRTVDGLLSVALQIADRETYGHKLQHAKALFDECVTEWSADSRDELKRLVMGAFEPSKDGTLNRESIRALTRLNIDDPRWKRAVEAINDAVIPLERKPYYRFHEAAAHGEKPMPIIIDLAAL